MNVASEWRQTEKLLNCLCLRRAKRMASESEVRNQEVSKWYQMLVMTNSIELFLTTLFWLLTTHRDCLLKNDPRLRSFDWSMISNRSKHRNVILRPYSQTPVDQRDRERRLP